MWGQRSRRGRGAREARVASQATTRQKDCGFIHSCPLGPGLNPSLPSPQPLLGRPPERVRSWPGVNSSPGRGFPVHILRPPCHSGPYLFAKVQKGKKRKEKKKKSRTGPERLPRGRLGLGLSVGVLWTGYRGTPVIMLKILTKC